MVFSNPRRSPCALFVAAMVAVIANRARAVDAKDFLYIPYNDMDIKEFGDHGPYKKDDPLRQHLHIYQAPSKTPTPVYLYSHGDGGDAKLSESTLDRIRRSGYSTISWESETKVGTNTLETCWADFDLVWSWFQSNAARYDLDPNNVIIGGRSRGSLCSWPLAYSERPQIKGIYMYNVLPDDSWDKKTQLDPNGDIYVWDQAITENAPMTHFLFGPECPKPITQKCKPSPKKKDKHNPKNGQKIVDVYKKLGIESKIKLTDGLINYGKGAHDLFPDFVESIGGRPVSAATAAGHSAKKIFGNFLIFSVCVALVVFGYQKYSKATRKRKQSHVFKRENVNSFRDELDDDDEENANANDDGLAMQDMGNTSYRERRGSKEKLDGIYILN